MKITFGKTTDDFHIYTDEGEEITDKLQIKSVNFNLKANQPTLVQLTCYAGSIEIFDTMAEVTIIDREGETN